MLRRLIPIALPSLALILQLGSANAETPVHTPPASMACPGDKIVWVNTRSHVYHYQGERYFGSTAHGKFMCERAAQREGDRPTGNGQ
jgi:hypothetical protein